MEELADFVQYGQDDLMRLWRSKVQQFPAAQALDAPSLDDHVRMVVDELVVALQKKEAEPMLKMKSAEGPVIHGLQRLRQGFNLTEVVAEYNALREALQEAAESNRISIAGGEYAIVNRVLDKAVAVAVQTYTEQKTLEIQQRREEHLSFVVHDLRTPLAAIATAANVLDQALPNEVKDARVSRLMGIVHRNTGRLNALISRVLQENANIRAVQGDVAFPAKVEKREFDLWPMIEELIRDLEPLTELKETTVINEVPQDCVVFADPELLRQVFQNLLSNAIDYTGKGQIVVGAEVLGRGEMHCWVRDTGAGIPPERIGKIFEKLETDPNKKGGLGLGLAVVKQIVEAHGGQITVASEAGQGCLFDFHFPHIDIVR
jgi:two-component system phosphate regulon sensor histidine kinase PhoR